MPQPGIPLEVRTGSVALEILAVSSQKAIWPQRPEFHSDHHLLQCLIYIDLNMVRAGVVDHPAQWKVSGYHEIRSRPPRYRIIDHQTLCRLTGMANNKVLSEAYNQSLIERLGSDFQQREPRWSESIAMGPKSYIEDFKSRLGIRAIHRPITRGPTDTFTIQDSGGTGSAICSLKRAF